MRSRNIIVAFTRQRCVDATLAMTKWLTRTQKRPQARLRLVCFPYAGAGAGAYRAWGAALSSDVEVWAVQPPGRESRFSETPFEDLRACAAEAVGAIRASVAPPFALFGHSMGSWLAFEAARIMQQAGNPPVHLFVSGRRAPNTRERFPFLSELPDDKLIEGLVERCDGMDPAILSNPDLLAVLMKAIRADVRAVDRYRPAEGPKLTMPILAFGGVTDRYVDREELEAWSHESVSQIRVEMLPGGHFFLHSAQSRLLALIAEAFAVS